MEDALFWDAFSYTIERGKGGEEVCNRDLSERLQKVLLTASRRRMRELGLLSEYQVKKLFPSDQAILWRVCRQKSLV